MVWSQHAPHNTRQRTRKPGAASPELLALTNRLRSAHRAASAHDTGPHAHNAPPSPSPVRIGTRDDYRTLAPFHYRAVQPATIDLVLCIDGRYPPQPAAVLVISRPTLNAAWRNIAWPARYDTKDKRADAERINAELRTISRVIVDPRYRALGMATTLVRAYLNNPLTPHTEAIAAMAAFCPFFQRAGMTPCHPPPLHANLRLHDAILHLRLQPGTLAAALQPTSPQHDTTPINPANHALLERELRLWARARPPHRAFAASPLHHLAQRADADLLSRRFAFAHAHTRTPNQPPHGDAA